jgi:hypothetical protein
MEAGKEIFKNVKVDFKNFKSALKIGLGFVALIRLLLSGKYLANITHTLDKSL